MQFRDIQKTLYTSIIFITLTGSIFFAYSASTSIDRISPYDMIVGKIDQPDVDFIITKMAFGGESGQINDVGEAEFQQQEFRFSFSHVIIEKDIDYSMVGLFLDEINRGTFSEFKLTITIYQNCVTPSTQCTVTSKLTFVDAFLAGYTSILNDLVLTEGTGFTGYDIFEFGFSSILIENPETIEDIPYDALGGGSQGASTSIDRSTNVRERDVIIGQNADWRITIGTLPEFKIYALQFRITAIISREDARVEGSAPYAVGYTFSDLYFQKDPLDTMTTLLLNEATNGIGFDAFINIGYCYQDRQCDTAVTINLYGTHITSLYTFLDDPTLSDNRMVAVEIFSLANIGFQYLVNY